MGLAIRCVRSRQSAQAALRSGASVGNDESVARAAEDNIRRIVAIDGTTAAVYGYSDSARVPRTRRVRSMQPEEPTDVGARRPDHIYCVCSVSPGGTRELKIGNTAELEADEGITISEGLHTQKLFSLVGITDLPVADIWAAAKAPDVGLFGAAHTGKLEVAEAAYALGADVEHRDQAQLTPLMRAVENGHLELAQWLHRVGALIDHSKTKHKNPYNLPLIHLACMCGHLAMAQWLCSEGEDPHCSDGFGRRPLALAKLSASRTVPPGTFGHANEASRAAAYHSVISWLEGLKPSPRRKGKGARKQRAGQQPAARSEAISPPATVGDSVANPMAEADEALREAMALGDLEALKEVINCLATTASAATLAAARKQRDKLKEKAKTAAQISLLQTQATQAAELAQEQQRCADRQAVLAMFTAFRAFCGLDGSSTEDLVLGGSTSGLDASSIEDTPGDWNTIT